MTLGVALDVAQLPIVLPGVLLGAAGGAAWLAHLNYRGTLALLPATVALALAPVFAIAGWVALTAAAAFALREYWRHEDIKKGHDKSRRARRAVGARQAITNAHNRRRLANGLLRRDDAYPVGIDNTGAVTWLPLGRSEGRHALLIGATGAGKTTTLLAAADAHLNAGFGLVAIDAKGDPALVDRLHNLARQSGRPFACFSLTGSSDRWNPLAHGTPSENADKLIAAENWTEPHYQRLYQRYLLTVFTAIGGRGEIPDLPTVVDLLDPGRLAMYARDIDDPSTASQVDRHLAELTDREHRDLAGLRNRIALLTEGDHGHLLGTDPEDGGIDLLAAVRQRHVVVFSLNSSRYPETTKLLAAALFQDIKGVAGILETDSSQSTPAAILVDEFSALGADQVVGIFQRARSAKLSLLLATQELADLRRVDPTLQDQIVGNVEAIIAHRQNVPDSAELVSEIGGTRETWIHTFQTSSGLGSHAPDVRKGTRHRGHEFHVSPNTVKQLAVGEAVVITKNPHAVHIVRIGPANTPTTKPSTENQR